MHYTRPSRPRQASGPQQPIQYVKGVGPARAEQLKRLGIRTVEETLWGVPRRYEDRSYLRSIQALQPGELATVRARVLAKSLYRTRGGKTIVEAALGDATGIMHSLWFNQPYLAKLLKIGDELIVHGRVEPGKRLQVIHPEIERLDNPPMAAQQAQEETDDAALNMGRIVPVYPLTSGLSQRWFRRIIRTALDHYADQLDEVLPAVIRERHQLCSFERAIHQIHFPESWETLEEARRRLAFEELFTMQVALALRRARLARREKPRRYQDEGPLVDALMRRLPFALTTSQRRVLDELRSDLCSPTPMLRLLQGDVGCGKTVVAAALMAIVVQSGYQVALMAPTELLAEQHAGVLRAYFEPLGVTVGLLAQGLPSAKRTQLLRDLARGSIAIVVGTHALLEAEVTFPNLALVIIDEQHKFGVVQRSAMARKAKTPDVLVMTATPIPRTLALTMYGDLACSTIIELPPGRLPVRSIWYHEAQRPEAYRLIRDELRQGRQGYVVYPLVDAQERREIRAATQMARQLHTDVFPEFRVALLHGQLRPKDKDVIMQAFVSGQIQLLVSTVIVEVGLDISNATIMLIEHPERFGLAQLHQLRGRIGRGSHQATCVLISETTDELARKRLAAFAQTTDGFRLAEADLELRGPGELLGRRQSGLLRFRVASLTRDTALLSAAREEACALVEQDPQLSHPELAALVQRLGAWRLRPN